MDIKESLRLIVKETRAKETSDLLPFVDDEPPSEAGRWTAKDNLAHMSAWRVHAAESLQAARVHREAREMGELDVANAAIYAETKDLSVDAVRERSRRSWDALASEIEACTVQDLLGARPGQPDRKAWEVVPGNTHGHLAEHLGYWHSERGDEASAEAAQLWQLGLDERAFDDPKQRGNAVYNLACYFARRGRKEEAMPYLTQSFKLNPSLREWARKDVDLDPIRGDDQVARLLH